MSDRTIVTGFGPFLDVVENPSATLAQGSGRRHEVLEVSYDAAEDFIFHLDPTSFDRLLLIGVAKSRSHMTPELFARNHYGATRDVRGHIRFGAIQDSAPLLLKGNLWTDEVIAAVLTHHLRTTRVSLDAGAYLCNFTYFKALNAFPSKQVGFLHVPMPDRISMEEQQQVLAELLELLES